MQGELERNAVAKAYARWAPVYDLVFGPVFEHGRRAAIAAAERVGACILEVGVGTGISLPDYGRATQVFAIDFSEPMLRKAQERAARQNLAQVGGLAVMDAERLGFADGQFDAVVGQFVITTMPHPEAALDEFARVTRPGGQIILVNHLGAESGLRRSFEAWVAPMARRLGWRPEFPFERLHAWAERTPGLRVIERRPVPPLGHFSLIRFSKDDGGAEQQAARAGT